MLKMHISTILSILTASTSIFAVPVDKRLPSAPKFHTLDFDVVDMTPSSKGKKQKHSTAAHYIISLESQSDQPSNRLVSQSTQEVVIYGSRQTMLPVLAVVIVNH